MNEYRWRDAAKEKPEDGLDVLVCFSGEAGGLKYHCCYSVGCYWAEDREWELQEFAGAPRGGIRVHGWKRMEPFELNPEKTILEDFLEKCPDAPMCEKGGIPYACAAAVGYGAYEDCCEEEEPACRDCWNRRMEE